MSYESARTRAVQVVARMKRDLDQYAARADANPAAVNVRRDIIAHLAAAIDDMDAAREAEIADLRQYALDAFNRGIAKGRKDAEELHRVREPEYPTGEMREKYRRHKVAEARDKWDDHHDASGRNEVQWAQPLAPIPKTHPSPKPKSP